MHQSFVTTVPPPTGNSGDDDFSSITALLKALYYGDLLRVIALLFIWVNSTGYIYVISQTRHLPGTAGELKRPLPRTLAPISPVHPRSGEEGGGGGYKWLVHYVFVGFTVYNDMRLFSTYTRQKGHIRSLTSYRPVSNGKDATPRRNFAKAERWHVGIIILQWCSIWYVRLNNLYVLSLLLSLPDRLLLLIIRACRCSVNVFIIRSDKMLYWLQNLRCMLIKSEQLALEKCFETLKYQFRHRAPLLLLQKLKMHF